MFRFHTNCWTYYNIRENNRSIILISGESTRRTADLLVWGELCTRWKYCKTKDSLENHCGLGSNFSIFNVVYISKEVGTLFSKSASTGDLSTRVFLSHKLSSVLNLLPILKDFEATCQRLTRRLGTGNGTIDSILFRRPSDELYQGVSILLATQSIKSISHQF